MRLKPIGNRVIVKRVSADKIGRIYVPESTRNASLEGEVTEIGADVRVIKVGDKVLFAMYSGFILPLGGKYKDCLVMNEEDILSTIE